MFPIFIIILGLLFRQGIVRSLRAGILIGIGFVGIFEFVDLFFTYIGPAAEGLFNLFGISLNTLDVGWGLASAITWAMPTAIGVIVICFVVNIIFLALKLTKTLDIDLWNYWAFGFTAALTYVVVIENTGDELIAYIIAMIFAAIHAILAFKISDWIAPCMADPENFNLPGISLPHGNAMMAPYAFAIDKVLRKIPVIGTVKADPDSVQEKYGFIGEPIFIGIVIGLLIGFFGNLKAWLDSGDILWNFPDFLTSVLTVGMISAAVIYLIPKMVGVLMEGLIPLSEGIREYITQRSPGREFLIGMDMAIIVGYPAVVAVALIMIPIALVLSLLLSFLPQPFNGVVLPYADLAGMVFYSVLAVMPSKGNIVRGTISGTIQLVLILMTAGLMAPIMTIAGTNYVTPAYTVAPGSYITSLDAGSNTIHWMLILLILPVFGFTSFVTQFGSNAIIMWFIIDIVWIVGYFGLWYLLRNEPTKISEEKIHA
jgi:PTS system galactitol-specific IIC component